MPPDRGNRLITDPRFTTASTKALYGTWSCNYVYTGEMMGTTGYLDELAEPLGELEALVLKMIK